MTKTDIPSPRQKRKQVSTRTRFNVFKRDGFRCQYCGAHPPSAILHCDHIKPVADGGTNDMENLVTACSNCNLGKAAVSLDVIPESLADRAKRIAEAEAQIKGYAEAVAAQRERIEDEAWVVIDSLFGVNELRRDWYVSIKRFVEMIGLHSCLEAVDAAAIKRLSTDDATFRYFCGACWKMSRE